MSLPIDAVLPALAATLAAGNACVLQAPPGTGKTTRVPLALLAAEFLGTQKIVMLEPRRLAARSAARYMAALLGEEVGQTVGYRTRLDTKISAATRIEVVLCSCWPYGIPLREATRSMMGIKRSVS